MWKCPRCNEEIECLDYKVETIECGHVYLPNTTNAEDANRLISGHIPLPMEYEQDDSIQTGRIKYACRICGDDIALSQLVFEEEQRQVVIDDRMEEEKHDIINPKINIRPHDGVSRMVIVPTGTSIICKNPECFKEFVVDPENRISIYSPAYRSPAECPKCGTMTSVGECEDLKKAGHYETLSAIKKNHANVPKRKHRRVSQNRNRTTRHQILQS